VSLEQAFTIFLLMVVTPIVMETLVRVVMDGCEEAPHFCPPLITIAFSFVSDPFSSRSPTATPLDFLGTGVCALFFLGVLRARWTLSRLFF